MLNILEMDLLKDDTPGPPKKNNMEPENYVLGKRKEIYNKYQFLVIQTVCFSGGN